MKTFSFIAAAALLSTGVLLADVAAADTTTKTRAQVVAELVQARSSGELARLNSEDSAQFLRSPTTLSSKSRAEVLAELQQARANGDLERYNTDDSAFALRHGIKTPSEVLAGQPRRLQQ